MISYYNSKHPGLYIYIILVSISVLSFLFVEISALQIGVLSILWGSFIFMRILSLYEISEHFSEFVKPSYSKNTRCNDFALAHDLVHRMRGENHIKRGILAMNAIEGRTLLWFILAFIYVAYSFYLSHDFISKTILIQKFSMFFMIGAGFWVGQTYAYSDHASRLLFYVFALLFGVTLFQMSELINSDILLLKLNIINSNLVIILASLIIYCSAILIYSCIKGVAYISNALFGLAIIFILSVSWVIFEHSSQSVALWISGWSLFSIFWVRSYSYTYKKYRLYQCQ